MNCQVAAETPEPIDSDPQPNVTLHTAFRESVKQGRVRDWTGNDLAIRENDPSPRDYTHLRRSEHSGARVGSRNIASILNAVVEDLQALESEEADLFSSQ